MSDYKQVQDALAAGTDPAMLCATCPWDRNCITPPTMTRSEIDAEIAKSQAQDDERMKAAELAGQKPTMPIGSLMTAIVMGGRDTSAQICPVFALRLRSSAGRSLADSVRSTMQKWDDES
jgi:hypothetical protein